MVLLTKIKTKSDLIEVINILRKEMIHIGTHEGLTSEKTIKISQKLDIYIAKYQALKILEKI